MEGGRTKNESFEIQRDGWHRIASHRILPFIPLAAAFRIPGLRVSVAGHRFVAHFVRDVAALEHLRALLREVHGVPQPLERSRLVVGLRHGGGDGAKRQRRARQTRDALEARRNAARENLLLHPREARVEIGKRLHLQRIANGM